MTAPARTRLAPSPTGALHLGNARTFLLNWLLARSAGWSVLLRIDDLDGPRVKPGADRGAIDDLRWLGLDWDEGPVNQSADLTPYRDALQQLADAGLTYRCAATRTQIEADASAPHADDHELRYPGTYRPAHARTDGITPPLIADDVPAAVRLIVPDGLVAFEDALRGPQEVDVQQTVGDFVLWTKSGLPAYQLAVVVDDARQGVTEVVRGDDLLSSTARQRLLYDAFNPGPPPRTWHLPLVVGEDGRRLAKRHGDTRLSWYRQAGVPVERVLGLLGWWSGLVPKREPAALDELMRAFKVERLGAVGRVVFTADDDAWLRGASA
jgi:glutamyl-tRNA synthetase